ncbi:hypothetical protein HDU67_008376 [Dinochytrium kinnereticum]|nr:hypothetical protein HDU67_008376 [Dinochytrium kinnereticum]
MTIMKPIRRFFQTRRFFTTQPRFQSLEPRRIPYTPSQRQAEVRFFGYLAFFGFTIALQTMAIPLDMIRSGTARQASLAKERREQQEKARLEADVAIAAEESGAVSGVMCAPHRRSSLFRSRTDGRSLMRFSSLGQGPFRTPLSDRPLYQCSRSFSSAKNAKVGMGKVRAGSLKATELLTPTPLIWDDISCMMEAPVTHSIVADIWEKYKTLTYPETTHKNLQSIMSYMSKAHSILSISPSSPSQKDFDSIGRHLLSDTTRTIPVSHPQDACSIIFVPDYQTAVEQLKVIMGPSLTYTFTKTERAHRIDKIFASLISQLLSRQNLDDAVRLFSLFRTISFPAKLKRRCLVPLTPLVIALVKAGRGKQALDLVSEFSSGCSGCGIGTETGGGSVFAFGRGYSTVASADARSVDRVALESLIEACRSFGEWRDVLTAAKMVKESLLTEFSERSLQLILDAQFTGDRKSQADFNALTDSFKGMDEMTSRRLFNRKIHGLCSDGKVDEAMAVFLQMKASEVSPDLVTYTSLIKGYTKRKDVTGVLRLHNEAMGLGFKSDLTHASAVLCGISSGADAKDALWVFLKMLEDRKTWMANGAPPGAIMIDATFCTGVLDRLGQHPESSQKLKAFDLTLHLVRHGAITPDRRLLNVLLSHYILHRFYLKVFKILRMIQKFDGGVDVTTLDTVLLSLVKDGRGGRALTFAKMVMMEGGTIVSVRAVRALVMHFTERKDFQAMWLWCQYALQHNLLLHNTLYVTVISSLVTLKAHVFAQKLTVELLTRLVQNGEKREKIEEVVRFMREVWGSAGNMRRLREFERVWREIDGRVEAGERRVRLALKDAGRVGGWRGRRLLHSGLP